MNKLIVLLLIITSCKMSSNKIDINGKYVIQKRNSGKCYVYNNGDSSVFDIPNKDGNNYSGFVLLNQKDSLICVKNCKSLDKVPLKSDIVLMNMEGSVIENITFTKKGEFVDYVFPSSKDNYILITLNRNEDSNDVSDIFGMPVSMFILDLKSKDIKRGTRDVSSRINMNIRETPWSPDETKVVYSILSRKTPSVAGEKPKKSNINSKPGIYVFDILENKHTRILDNGRDAIWSPKDNIIAYLNQNSIFLYNTITKVNEELFDGKDVDVHAMHWTEDGKYLLVIQANNRSIHSGQIVNEQLIRINDGEILKVNNPKFGLNNFSWKGSIRK